MKMFLKIAVGVIVALVCAVLIRNSVLRKVTRTSVLKTTGFDIEIGRLYAGLWKPVFEVSDARLINPEDFPEATALEIKTLRVGYDWRSLFSDEIHLSEITVDVPRAVLVIREDGESNLARLGKTLEEKKEKAETEKGEGKEGKPASGEKAEKPSRPIRIDTLTLKMGRVEMHRYREGESKPEIKSYDVNLSRTATNVTDLQTINAMITAAAIEAVGKQALESLSKVFEKAEPDLKKAGDAVQKAADKLADRLRRAAERAEKSAGD
jgi:uncharacterized protein involved in outer membrane biogenesis